MSENLSQALQKLIQTVRLRHPLGQEAPPSVWVTNASGKGKSIYVNWASVVVSVTYGHFQGSSLEPIA